MSPRRDAWYFGLLALALAAATTLTALRGGPIVLRLLGAGAMLAAAALFLGALRRHDDEHFGRHDLLVACDHAPEGVEMPGLTRHELHVALRRLDPEHHLVWINRQPYDLRSRRVP